MIRTGLIIAFLGLWCCTTSSDPAPSSGPLQGTTVRKNPTWNVTDLVISGSVVISPSSPANERPYFELTGSQYITDNSVNECNGRFTTDNISKIDFEEKMTCTATPGDPLSFSKFKAILTQQVTQYSVNSDSTRLVLFMDSETYIRLTRSN